jgi:starvation-inducible DNA-binding protein
LCPFLTRTVPVGQDGLRSERDDDFDARGIQEVANLRKPGKAHPEDGGSLRVSPVETPTDLGAEATRCISAALNALLADMFVLYLKTKNFHWHMSGPHSRDFHRLLDEQAEKIYAVTDVIAERVRKIGAPTLRSIGDISRRQRLLDNDAEHLAPFEMLAELREDNLQLAAFLRETHDICEELGDVASAGFLEAWIDEAEQRVWWLFEVCRTVPEPTQ